MGADLGADVSAGLATAPPDSPRRPRGRPRKTWEQRDDGNRRQELIRSAARLFRARGLSATSTRDIAAAVGLQSGSPFYHFKSKNALLCEVMEQGMHSAIARQAATLQALRAAEPQAALAALIRTHFDILLGADSDFIPVPDWRPCSATPRAAPSPQPSPPSTGAREPVLAPSPACGRGLG